MSQETPEKSNGCILPGFTVFFGGLGYSAHASIPRLAEYAASTGDKLGLITAEVGTGILAIATITCLLGTVAQIRHKK